MILKSIKLSNIRSYLSQEIKFPEGSLLLSGDIGSGKSTILQAVEFALFGILKTDLSGTSLLRRGKNSGSVELNFEIDGKNIIIKRALKALKDSVKQDAGYIIINDMKYDMMPTELKTKILEQLGYPDELVTKSKSLIYRYTVYTPQEEMKQILFEDKSARLDTLRRVFGIDKYKRIAENAGILVKNLKEQKKELSGKIFDIEDKLKQKEKLESEIKELKKKIDGIMPKYNEFKSEIEGKKAVLKEFEDKIIILNNLKRELDVTETKIDAVAKRKDANVKEISGLQKQIKELNERIAGIKIKKFECREEDAEKELKALETEFLTASKRMSELAENHTQSKKRSEELKNEIKAGLEKTKSIAGKESMLNLLKQDMEARKDAEERLDSAEKEVIRLAKMLSEYEALKRHSSETKDKIKGMDKCPTCAQSVDESHKHKINAEENKKIESYEKQIEEVNQKKYDSAKKLDELKKMLRNFEEKGKIAERLRTEIESLRSASDEIGEKQELLSKLLLEIITIEREIGAKNIEAEKKNLEEKKLLLKAIQEQKTMVKEKEMVSALCQEKMSRADALTKEETEIKQLMEGLKLGKTKIEKDIESLRDTENKFIQSKKELEGILEKSKSTEIKKAELDKENELLDKNLTELNKEIKIKNEVKDSIVDLSEKQYWLEEFFVNLMFEMEKHMMNSVRAEFNELFQQWCSLLLEDDSISIKLDEEFAPVVEQNGYQTELFGMSGGEKTSCALAYRLALNRVINNMMSTIKTRDIIILDEPTDGFSTEQLDKVRDVLEQLNARQVIIVSHEAKLESFVQNIIRIEKEGHVSRISG